ncbi:MAG: hypothetical protein KDK37_07245 [Leptospiraceae bacterium]|nr:hypothetical protein [Leptospiraceae bacterium]MCB1304055.1 hypothetical protein [Leptospiraceae bacterium]
MNLADRIIALESIFPFSRLREGELAALANVCTERQYAPSEPLVVAGQIMKRFVICVQGGFVDESGPDSRRLFGAHSLLFDQEQDRSLTAGPQGALCLVMQKGHFFRTMYELPEVSEGIVALEASRRQR